MFIHVHTRKTVRARSTSPWPQCTTSNLAAHCAHSFLYFTQLFPPTFYIFQSHSFCMLSCLPAVYPDANVVSSQSEQHRCIYDGCLPLLGEAALLCILFPQHGFLGQLMELSQCSFINPTCFSSLSHNSSSALKRRVFFVHFICICVCLNRTKPTF